MNDNTIPVQTYSIESWGWSQCGHLREENQDNYLNWPEGFLWAVADGVGGSSGGALASRTIIEKLLELVPSTNLEEYSSNTLKQIEKANASLLGKGSSTIVTLLIQGGSGECLWAGDSRCYLLRLGMLYQCTKDHTLRQQKIDGGELTVPEARRMVRGNIITNAIGATKNVVVDRVKFQIKPGDRLLLCSDGLTKILSPESLARLIATPSAKQAADNITEAINYHTQPDNITFICVFVLGNK